MSGLAAGPNHRRARRNHHGVALTRNEIGCAEAVPQIQTVEWSKYALFLSWMAPAVLTRLASCKFQNHPDTAVVVAQLMRETGLLAAQLGIPLEDREPLSAKTLCAVAEVQLDLNCFG